MKHAIIGRGVRFSLVGVICTAISYVTFTGLSRVVHYEIANVGAWAAGMVFGFALNRRFTYRIRGEHERIEQFARFLIGSLGQLLVSAVAFWVLIGLLKLPPWAAFPIGLAVTSAYMFAYLESVTFRNGTVELR